MGTRCRENENEIADLSLSSVVAIIFATVYLRLYASFDMGYKPKFRQDLLIEHIQELVKTSNGFISSMCFMLVSGTRID